MAFRLVVALSVVAWTLLCGLRFGMPADTATGLSAVFLGLPMIPIAVLFMRWPTALPSVVVFACGLLTDVLSQSEFGLWALVYLVVGAVAKLIPASLQGGWGRTIWSLVTGASAFLPLVAVAWFYTLLAPDWMFCATVCLVVALGTCLVDRLGSLLGLGELKPSSAGKPLRERG